MGKFSGVKDDEMRPIKKLWEERGEKTWRRLFEMSKRLPLEGAFLEKLSRRRAGPLVLTSDTLVFVLHQLKEPMSPSFTLQKKGCKVQDTFGAFSCYVTKEMLFFLSALFFILSFFTKLSLIQK